MSSTMTAFYATAFLALAAGQPPAAERPTVLVLDDYTLVEGQVTEIPDFHDATGETKLFRVTSAGEVRTLAAKQVLFRGGTRQEAFRYVKGKWNPTSADAHIKLAEWCREAGLVGEALAEAKAAATVSPPDPYLAKLIRELEAKRAEDRTVRIVRPTAATASVPRAKPTDMPAVDPAIVKSFGQTVQPILTNQCVACHADPKHVTKFVLARVPEGETAGPAMSKNLVASLAQLRADAPDQSPLLTYATRRHGGQAEAAETVQHPAYRHLSTWVAATAATLPKAARPTATPGAAVPPASSPPKVPLPADPAATDPFDPAEFNRSAGPAKKR
jgi:hypothetical protein